MDVPEPPTGLNALLLDQLTFHWTTHLRPRLDGLTDHEYFWEPVPGCWSLRPRGEGAAPILAGGGELLVEFAHPAPGPAPVTTIAWRLVHLADGVFGIRNAAHFGGPPIDFFTQHHPTTAAMALTRLDAAYDSWVAGVGALGDAGLERPVGPAEGPYAAHPYATLVLHIHREVIHHGAEILLLRDLYRGHRQPAPGRPDHLRAGPRGGTT